MHAVPASFQYCLPAAWSVCAEQASDLRIPLLHNQTDDYWRNATDDRFYPAVAGKEDTDKALDFPRTDVKAQQSK